MPRSMNAQACVEGLPAQSASAVDLLAAPSVAPSAAPAADPAAAADAPSAAADGGAVGGDDDGGGESGGPRTRKRGLSRARLRSLSRAGFPMELMMGGPPLRGTLQVRVVSCDLPGRVAACNVLTELGPKPAPNSPEEADHQVCARKHFARMGGTAAVLVVFRLT